MNGRELYYKCYRASEQGYSEVLMSFLNVSNENNKVIIVYGYNKGLEVDNYEVTVIEESDTYSLKFNLPKKEYFIDIFNGQFRGINGVWGSYESNKNQYFLD